MTLTLSWWALPTLITVAGPIWALFIYDDKAGPYSSGIGNIFMLVPVLLVSVVSWILAAVLK